MNKPGSHKFPSGRSFAVGQADLSGRLRLFDEELAILLHRNPEDLIGCSLGEITRKDYRQVSAIMFDSVVRTGEPYRIETVYCGADGVEIPATANVCLLRCRDGKPEAVVAVIQPHL